MKLTECFRSSTNPSCLSRRQHAQSVSSSSTASRTHAFQSRIDDSRLPLVFTDISPFVEICWLLLSFFLKVRTSAVSETMHGRSCDLLLSFLPASLQSGCHLATQTALRHWLTTNLSTSRSAFFRVENLARSDTLVKGSLTTCTGRPDIVWTVSQHTSQEQSQTWNRACDHRLTGLISYILCTVDCRQRCYLGDQLDNSKTGLLQNASFTGELQDSKSTSGDVLTILGERTYVPISWKCKMQTALSHSSPEAEIVSLGSNFMGMCCRCPRQSKS